MSGETLGVLADRYGTSVEALALANGIGDVNQIRAGQMILIPSTAPSVQEQRILLALTQAEALYRGALFADAKRATRELRAEDMLSPVLRARIELLRGQIEVAFGHRSAARAHFEAALTLDPQMRLRRGASPKVAGLFPAPPQTP